MHAVAVLQKCLADVFASMHASRARVLLGAVDALVRSRRLILIELARAWPGASRVRAPLKRLDRLLSNPHLSGETERFYRAMAAWLIRHPRPIILVDWSDLKPDGRWHLLRAAIPSGGRALTVLEAIYPERQKNSPRVERQFLARLKAVLPAHAQPILVTDSGFRTPWFRAVRRLGWDYVGRLRNRTLVRLRAHGAWIPNRALHRRARRRPRRYGGVSISQKQPWACDLVLARRPRQRRRSVRGYRKAQAANREPWLLATSLRDVSARQVVALYGQRMQIEQSFRDLKCDRYGCAFYYSLTRRLERLAVLLLLHALATFLAWLTALSADRQVEINHGALAARRQRRCYSRVRLGWEMLRTQRMPLAPRDVLKVFRHPPPWVLQELGLPR